MVEYPDVTLFAGRQKKKGALHWSSSPSPSSPVSSVEFRAEKGKPVTINLNDIDGFTWTESFDGYQWKLTMKGGMVIKFTHLPQKAFSDLDSLVQTLGKNIKRENLATKGKNEGQFKITEQMLSFYVENQLAFDLPLSAVTQPVAQSKNEVALEIAHEDLPPTVEALAEIRVFIPDEVREEKEAMEDDEEKSEEEEEEKPTSAYLFFNEIISKQSSQGDKAVITTIASFKELFLSVPRAKYDVDLNKSFLKLHNKTYSYRINYENIKKMFLFDNKDEGNHYFVMALDPAVRQGRTSYPYIVMRFPSDELIEQTFNLTDEQINEYGGLIKKVMKGPTYDVVTRVFKAITGAKVLIPGAGYSSKSGNTAIKCSHRANEGHLFMLEKSFFFLHKPPIYIRHPFIKSCEFDRVSHSSLSKTFDLKFLVAEAGKDTEYVFNGVNKDEYDGLFSFIKSKQISVTTSIEESSRAERGNKRGEDDDAYMRQMDQDGANNGNSDEDSEDDEDFTSGSDSDSGSGDGSGGGSGSDDDSDMASEVSESEGEGGGGKGKKRKRGGDKDKEKEKDDDEKPKRAIGKPSAFLYFSAAKRAEFVKENPSLSGTEIMKEMGAKWKSLSEEEKEPFAKAAVEQFNKKMAEAKERGEDGEQQEKAKPKKKSSSSSSSRSGEPKKVRTAFNLFSDEKKSSVRASNPGKSAAEQVKILREMWANMSEDDQQEYKEKQREDSNRYKKEMEEWKKTHPEGNKKEKEKEKGKTKKKSVKNEGDDGSDGDEKDDNDKDADGDSKMRPVAPLSPSSFPTIGSAPKVKSQGSLDSFVKKEKGREKENDNGEAPMDE